MLYEAAFSQHRIWTNTIAVHETVDICMSYEHVERDFRVSWYLPENERCSSSTEHVHMITRH